MNTRLLLCILFVLIVVMITVSGVFFSPSKIQSSPSIISTTASTQKTSPVAQDEATTTPQVSPTALQNGPAIGISFGDTLPSLSSDELNARLDDVVSLGVTWMRFDISWQDIQSKNSTSYNWTDIDRIVAAADARHIHMLPDIAYTPAWARPVDCMTSSTCAPADPNAFAAFAKAVVTRYSSQGISDWEIWNEPNIQEFWQPTPSAHNYSVLLKDTYTIIKSVEPSSTVVSGGLAPSLTNAHNIAPLDFLTDMYADGDKDYFDAVGFHPYSFPLTSTDAEPWNAWTQMSETSPSLRSIMIHNGDTNKKIWLTEYGAPTGGPDDVTESKQATMLTDAVQSVQNLPWAGPMFWYSYQDLGTATDTNENFFGLLRFDGSAKPAYTTLKTLLTNH